MIALDVESEMLAGIWNGHWIARYGYQISSPGQRTEHSLFSFLMKIS
jgi:hypothetical protein